jgi:DNA-binding transcriptional LysR family regulator
MRRLTLRQLKIFDAVARHLSYSRAAEELHLSQPAVSMQVHNLESFVGLPLTEQLGKKVFLTDAGREVARTSQVITAQLADLKVILDHLKGAATGTFNLGVTATANSVATQFLAPFRAGHPQVSIHLTVSNRAEMLDRLANNRIDLAIMGQPPEGLDLAATRFMDNPLVVIAPVGHRLARKRRVSLQDLASEPFVVRETGSGTRAAMERFFAARGVTIHAGMEMNSNEAIKQAVQAGLGLGILSLNTVEPELALRRVAVLKVEGFPILRHWYVVHRTDKRLSPVAEAFKTFVLGKGAAHG